jgi:succinyl-CoA synthetase alpha subunit
MTDIEEAMKTLKPDATGIYVAAHQATAAIEEAIEAQVPLIVAVAEHIPVHDFLRVCMIPSRGNPVLCYPSVNTLLDTFDAEDSVCIQACRGKFSRYHLIRRKV